MSQLFPSLPAHPLWGHLADAYGERQLDFYQKCIREVGPLFEVKVPVIGQWYFLAHPGDVEKMLTASYLTFSKGLMWNRVRRVLGDGLLTNDAKIWRSHRSAMQPAFSTHNHPRFASVMRDSIALMLERWEQKFAGGEPFDLLEEMSRVTIQNAGLLLFSTDMMALYDRLGPELNYIVKCINANNFAKPWTANPRLLWNLRQLHAWIDELIETRRALMAKDNAPDDLLTYLLRGQTQTGAPFSKGELHDEILTFLFVGHETTALSLGWAFAMLSQNPHEAQAATQEIRANCGREVPTLEQLELLPRTKAIFLETLRLYPPVWAVARQTTEPVEIAGKTVAKGKIVVCMPYITQRMEEFWPNPNRFDSHRFDEGAGNGRPRYAYFPFGGGSRVCIGLHFAMIEAQMVLAGVLSRFHPQLVPEQKLDVAPWATLRPRYGLRAFLQPAS